MAILIEHSDSFLNQRSDIKLIQHVICIANGYLIFIRCSDNVAMLLSNGVSRLDELLKLDILTRIRFIRANRIS